MKDEYVASNHVVLSHSFKPKASGRGPFKLSSLGQKLYHVRPEIASDVEALLDHALGEGGGGGDGEGWGRERKGRELKQPDGSE